MESNWQTWCTWDALEKVYIPMAEREPAVINAESFRTFVLGIVEPMTRDHRDAREMLDAVEWEKLREYCTAQWL